MIHRKNKIKTPVNERVVNVVLYVLFGLFTILCIYPFYYLVINTISSNELSSLGKILLLPKGIHFENYKKIIKIPGLINATKISVGRTVLGTLVTVFGSSFLGFMFTQQKMWKRKLFYRFIVITMYFNAGLIPWYITMNNLHLTNNFLAYILPAFVTPFNIILVKTYIESTPKALQEAAEIDGASIVKIYARIIVPLSKPILATVAIFSAVGQWNSFQDALLLMTDQKNFTLQFILYKYINQASSLAALIKNSGSATSSVMTAATKQTAMSVRMTVSVLVVIPIMLVYPFFQKYFVKGVMIGSVKG